MAEAGSARRALGIYVHWPYCAAICPYCDFNVYKARGQASKPVLEAIVADLAGWRETTGPRPVGSVFFGGGTPSLMAAAEVARVIETVGSLWGLEPGAEITLEANPTDAEARRFSDFRAAGVERLSLGVQALDDASLKALGRFHSAEEAVAAARVARAVFPRLSIDLIHSRHGQSLQAWEDELLAAVALEPDHVSPYQLTIEPGTAFERAVRRGVIVPPDNDLAADFHESTQALLEDAGFEAYEVSNHARAPEARSRHNLVYWTSQDWIGVGPGAHGRLGFGAGRLATRAALRPEAYVAAVQTSGCGADERETLDESAARAEYWLMGLRLSDGARHDAAPGPPLDLEALARAMSQGLAWQSATHTGLTSHGRMVADSVIATLI